VCCSQGMAAAAVRLRIMNANAVSALLPRSGWQTRMLGGRVSCGEAIRPISYPMRSFVGLGRMFSGSAPPRSEGAKQESDDAASLRRWTVHCTVTLA
jgi:hypothetical protein